MYLKRDDSKFRGLLFNRGRGRSCTNCERPQFVQADESLGGFVYAVTAAATMAVSLSNVSCEQTRTLEYSVLVNKETTMVPHSLCGTRAAATV